MVHYHPILQHVIYTMYLYTESHTSITEDERKLHRLFKGAGKFKSIEKMKLNKITQLLNVFRGKT